MLSPGECDRSIRVSCTINDSKLSKASDSYKTLQGVISNDPEASYWAVSYKKYGEKTWIAQVIIMLK
jgi:hypothetical protein